MLTLLHFFLFCFLNSHNLHFSSLIFTIFIFYQCLCPCSLGDLFSLLKKGPEHNTVGFYYPDHLRADVHCIWEHCAVSVD